MKNSFLFFFIFLLSLGRSDSLKAGFDAVGFGAPCIDLVYKIDEKLLQSVPVRKGDGQRASWETFSFV